MERRCPGNGKASRPMDTLGPSVRGGVFALLTAAQAWHERHEKPLTRKARDGERDLLAGLCGWVQLLARIHRCLG
jgi:hypothetical protein